MSPQLAVRTAEGAVGVRIPQVRDAAAPYRSTLMGSSEGDSAALERLVKEMYVRDLREVEEYFRNECAQGIGQSLTREE